MKSQDDVEQVIYKELKYSFCKEAWGLYSVEIAGLEYINKRSFLTQRIVSLALRMVSQIVYNSAENTLNII